MRSWRVAVVGLVFFSSSVVLAQTGLSGFNAKTYYPSFDQSGVASLIGSKPLLPWYSSLGFHYSLMTDPLGVAAGMPSETISEQMYGDFVYALGFPGKLVLGIDVPVVFNQNGNSTTGAAYESTGVGDMLLNAKWCFLCFWDKAAENGFGAALVSRTFIPTGTRADFTGSSTLSQDFLLVLDKEWDFAQLYVNGGYRLAPYDARVGGEHDDEYLYAIGARFPLLAQDGTWSAFVAAQGSILKRHPSDRDNLPLEGIVGFEKTFTSGVRAQVGFGERPYAAVGAPRHHLFAGIAFVQPEGKGERFTESITSGSKLVLFTFDSSVLDDGAIESLDEVVAAAKADDEVKIALEGRADDTGSPEYNMNLSQGRAISAKAYLAQHGIEETRILLQWFGETRPLVEGPDVKARVQNRSVMVNYLR